MSVSKLILASKTWWEYFRVLDLFFVSWLVGFEPLPSPVLNFVIGELSTRFMILLITNFKIPLEVIEHVVNKTPVSLNPINVIFMDAGRYENVIKTTNTKVDDMCKKTALGV